MGAYFADYFTKSGYKVIVSDSRTRLTNKELASKADVVIISVPIGITEKVIEEVAPLIKKEGVIMDLTSLKEFPVKAMIKTKSEVIGLHPMFSHTNPLPGQTVIACPARGKKWYPWIKSFLEGHGAKVIRLSPRDHDKIMAAVQALVHFADIAFGHALKGIKFPVNDYLKYATPSSELKIAFAARLLAQDADLYANIQIKNPHAEKVLRQYVKSINELIEISANGDIKSFKKYFDSAGNYLKDYRKAAFDDTNYLIYAILERRKRTGLSRSAKLRAGRAAGHIGPAKYDMAVLGPSKTYSDLAAMTRLAGGYKQSKIYYASSIREVFLSVTKGEAKTGLVPLENLINGSVRETYDALFEENVHIEEKFSLPVKHALVALQGVTDKDIDTVSSHPQALEQCAGWLGKKFPQVQISPTPSTIAAYEKMLGENDRHTAVIIPQTIAESQNCNILATEIGDIPANITSFIIIKKGKPHLKMRKSAPFQAKAKPETSIAFHFQKDRPGSLLKIFRDISDAGLNMTKIESRPSKKDPGNYIFFLCFEGDYNNPAVKKVLKKIEKKVVVLKLLGSYNIETA